MQKPRPPAPSFLKEIAPWIRGKKLAIYLQGRNTPITGLTIKYIGHDVIVARWNSSTHLIPLHAVAYMRFAPDNDPCRDPTHTLNSVVNSRKPPKHLPAHTPETPELEPCKLNQLSHDLAQQKRVG